MIMVGSWVKVTFDQWHAWRGEKSALGMGHPRVFVPKGVRVPR